jgi:hypothetical protein
VFALPAVSVSWTVPPASTVALDGDTLSVGVPAVHGGGTGFVTVTFATASACWPLSALVTFASTEYVPVWNVLGTATLSDSRAMSPGASATSLPPNASDQPFGTTDARRIVSAPQPSELLLRTLTASCIAPPCSMDTCPGDISIDGVLRVHVPVGGGGGGVGVVATRTDAEAVARTVPLPSRRLKLTG